MSEKAEYHAASAEGPGDVSKGKGPEALAERSETSGDSIMRGSSQFCQSLPQGPGDSVTCEKSSNAGESGELRSVLGQFVEYFGAIYRGEVGPPRERLRTFELILLDAGKAALASRPKAEGRIYSGVPYLKYDFGTTKPKSITPADGKYFEVIVREVLERGE